MVIPAGEYDWLQHAFEYQHNPSAPLSFTARYRIGNYYDGDFNAIELTSDFRLGSRFNGSAGWTRQDIDLPQGAFVADLVPVQRHLSTSPRWPASRRWCSTTARPRSSRPTCGWRCSTAAAPACSWSTTTAATCTSFTPIETLGRSFVIKFTRLFDL